MEGQGDGGPVPSFWQFQTSIAILVNNRYNNRSASRLAFCEVKEWHIELEVTEEKNSRKVKRTQSLTFYVD